MKSPKSILSLFPAILIAGCAGQAWYQPGKTDAEARRDFAACKAEQAKMNNPLGMLNGGFFWANEANKGQFLDNCMIAKGYSAVNKNSLPTGVTGAPK